MLLIKNLKSPNVGPIDLSIAAGDCVAIRGASAAGKSLLLRAIADFDANEGTVKWNNRSRSNMPAPEWRELVGLLPADSGWWVNRIGGHLSAFANAAKLLDDVGLSLKPAALLVAALWDDPRQHDDGCQPWHKLHEVVLLFPTWRPLIRGSLSFRIWSE